MPSRDSTWAQESPAGPAPTMATFLPFESFLLNNFDLPFIAFSVDHLCSLAISIGFLSNKLKTQFPSHNFSTGQTLEQPPPKMLEIKMVCAEPLMLSVVICLMNFGISILVGQPLIHGAS